MTALFHRRSSPTPHDATIRPSPRAPGRAPDRTRSGPIGRSARDLGATAMATSRVLLACLALGAVLAQPAAAETSPSRGEGGSAHASSPRNASATGKSPSPPERRNLADELFTEAEREAWRQKIAAAPDEAQKRQLRGQRLAELQRRSREAKAAAGTGKPSTAPAREAR